MAMNTAATVETTPARLKMSYEAFLEWAGEDTHAEWVDGEVIILMPPTNIHQISLGFLYQLLDLFVRLDETGEYELYGTEDDEQVASQVVPGFWLRPAWLWQAGLNPLTCSLEIEGVAAALLQQIEQVSRSGQESESSEEQA